MPEETVALAARGRGQGPDPAVIPVPTEFRKIAGGGVGETRILRPNLTPPPVLGDLNNNLPDGGAGWTLHTDQNFGTWADPMADGWQDPINPDAYWSVATTQLGTDNPIIMDDATAPSGNGRVFRQNYVGTPDGHQPKFLVTSLGNELSFFMGFYVKFAETWTTPVTSGLKWHIANGRDPLSTNSQSEGWLGLGRSRDLTIDQAEPAHSWVFNGTCANMDGLCGTPESQGAVRFYSAPDPAEAGVMFRGQWHKVQYYLSKNPAIVRMWIDDVLVIERTGFTWTQPTWWWQSMQIGATRGGGASWGGSTATPAPEGTIIYYDRFQVYKR